MVRASGRSWRTNPGLAHGVLLRRTRRLHRLPCFGDMAGPPGQIQRHVVDALAFNPCLGRTLLPLRHLGPFLTDAHGSASRRTAVTHHLTAMQHTRTLPTTNGRETTHSTPSQHKRRRWASPRLFFTTSPWATADAVILAGQTYLRTTHYQCRYGFPQQPALPTTLLRTFKVSSTSILGDITSAIQSDQPVVFVSSPAQPVSSS